jgi:mono/diheme cytochrome c family protein
MPHMPSKVTFTLRAAALAAVLLAQATAARAASPQPAVPSGLQSPLARTFTPWDKAPPPSPPVTDELRANGERIFRGACVGCHGEKGDGTGREGKYLPIPPRDFVTAQFLCRHTPSGSLPRDEDLFRSIRHGFKSQVGMPSFRFLSDREVWAVISFVKTLSTRWKEEEVPAAIVVPAPPPYSADAAARGHKLYNELGCVKCHGDKGFGDGKSAAALRYDNETPIRPADFSKPKDFKCGDRPYDIFRTLTNGMDGTPMPSFVDNVTDAQRWDLVQYVVSVGNAAEATPQAAQASAAGR